jgi:hypothetical protein
MTNATINKMILAAIDSSTRKSILSNIAGHYGISEQDAYDEVTDIEAEHICDYLTGETRTAASLIIKRHGF